MNKKLVYSAIIASIYTALSMLLAPISYGIFQFRIAEGLCLLPLIMPESILGLTLGCLITNSWGIIMGFNPLGVIDVFLGTFATFLAAVLTGKINKMPYSALPPIVLNMFIVGGELTYIETGKLFSKLYVINCAKIFTEETICIFLIGIPLCKIIDNVLQNTKKN